MTVLTTHAFLKDQSLDRLAKSVNVAQFVSYGPGETAPQRYSRVLGFEPNHQFNDCDEAVRTLMSLSVDCSVNIRSFRPDEPRSNEFVYGLTDQEVVVETVQRMTKSGLFVIVNETIDIHDGGVSGVVQGGIIEFSPDDTPRCVEKPGVASLPRNWGTALLQQVYGFPIDFGVDDNARLEFSIHPRPRGWRHSHILGWELEDLSAETLSPTFEWPNNFSRMIGDKAFGLLLGAQVGLPVPKTTVIGRRIAPFSFGVTTDSHEVWIRTCPREQVPGKFTTLRGWADPFELMSREDPEGNQIASILSQSAVRSEFSGALIVDATGQLIVEGRRGEGEILMKGRALPEPLPDRVVYDVRELYGEASTRFGPVRFEWVHDGDRAWIVQLHRGATVSSANTIVPGKVISWRRFVVSEGLAALREELASLKSGEGIVLVGQVGLTSHIADAVRKAGKPARID